MTLKDNKIFRIVIISICVLFCLIGRFIPINGLPSVGSGVLFIFLASLVMWLTIGFDWPSLLCIVSLGFLNYTSFGEILKSSFGDQTFLFLLFTFILTNALSRTTIIKKIVYGFVNNKIARKNGYLFIFLFLFAILLIGLFISPTVLFAIALPITEEIIVLAKLTKEDKVAKVLIMGLAFSVSISCSMTPIAHVFIVLAWKAANIHVSFLSYIAFAIPVGLIIFGFMILVFFIYLKKDDIKKLQNIDVGSLKNSFTRLEANEIITLVIFILVLVIWILPSLLKSVCPNFYEVMNTRMGLSIPPMVGIIILCAIKIKDKQILELTSALKEGIPWGSLLMCAATLALGASFTNPNVALDKYFNNIFSSSLSHLPAIACLIIFGLWATLQTNVSSNMVTATLVATVAASVISGAKIPINLNATISIIGFLAGLAFATPPAMPHIALAGSNKYCDTKSVLIFGSITMVISLICTLCIGYPIAMMVM